MARKSTALAYISFTCTQGSNDAFVQTQIATALSGQTKVSYRMASLELELPAPVNIDASDLQFNLTRKSYAAMPTSPMLEKSTIFAYRRWGRFTTSGMLAAERSYVKTWSNDDAPIIVEDPIYAQLDSAAYAATLVLYGRIGYWIDSISEVDRLQLIANSLS